MFVQIQFNHITTKNSFMITVRESKRNSGKMFFGHLSFKLVQSLHFSTHASRKQNSQRQNMVNFYSIKHRKFNLRFFCCSVYMRALHLGLAGDHHSHFPVRYCVAYNQTIYVVALLN